MNINILVQGIQGIREWYGNLNSATLTGAIDVIVIEQEDGTFLSSPFHVRFGKLGVLKAKEKIVDIEINNEPVDIHMKLDDGGAAFFVESIENEDEAIAMPVEYATSPLPGHKFPLEFEKKEKAERAVNRSLIEAFDEETHAESSGSISSSEGQDVRNVTYKRKPPEQGQLKPDEVTMEEGLIDLPELGTQTKEAETNMSIQTDLSSTCRGKQKRKKRNRRTKHNRSGSKSSIKELISESGGLSDAQNLEDIQFDIDDMHDGQEVDLGGTPTPTHHPILDLKVGGIATMLSGTNSTSTSVPSTPIALMSPTILEDDITPTQSQPSHSTSMPRLQMPAHTIEMCTLPSQGSSHSTVPPNSHSGFNENSFLSARLPDQQQLDSMLSKQESDISEDSDEGRKNLPSARNDQIQYFSEPETYSPITSPLGSRPSSPIMSDSEIMSSESSQLRKTRENEEKERGEQSWEWGKLPTTTTPAQDKVRKASLETTGNKKEDSKTEDATEDSKWTFWWSTSSKRNKTEDKTSKKVEIKEDKTSPGVTLESLTTEEEIRKYIGSHFHGDGKTQSVTTGQTNSYGQTDSDAESGNGPSLPMSPHSVEGIIGDDEEGYSRRFRMLKEIDISLCGGLNKAEGFSTKLFELRKVAFDDYAMQLKMGNNIFDNPDLVLRIGDHFYNWKTACPIIMSNILFGRPLPSDILAEMGSSVRPSQKDQDTNGAVIGESSTLTVGTNGNDQRKSSSWWQLFGSKGNTEESMGLEGCDKESPDREIAAAFAAAAGAPESNQSGVRSPTTSTPAGKLEAVNDTTDNASQLIVNVDQVDNISQQINEIQDIDIDTNLSVSQSEKDVESASINISDNISVPTDKDVSNNVEQISSSAEPRDGLPSTPPRISQAISTSSVGSSNEGIPLIVGKYKKTLRLSTESIHALKLRRGSNEVQFSVTTAYQGTTKCRCHLYLWKWTDRIVVSDIDGTITKSDVLGHVLPIIGKDWAQSGVASLFSKIVDNGYHIAYLSARAIGQAAVTKEYLNSVNQSDMNLPDGPLLLNPTSLVNAFHREVVLKKPEEFKIACLRDIQKLFPEDGNPFYAGYGNRTNDVYAYRAVGIPISRIFTINPRGELRHEITQTFQTSYCNQSSIVDHIFPAPSCKHGHVSSTNALTYSTFTFWREPIPEIDVHVEDETTGSPKK